VKVWQKLAALLAMIALPVLAIALGNLAYSIFISTLGIFLLVGRVIFPSLGMGAPKEILRLQRPAGTLAVCFGLFLFLDARRLLPEAVAVVAACAFFLAMAWFTVAFWKFLCKRREAKKVTRSG